MSFEIIDNLFQVIVLGIMAVHALLMALHKRSREFLLLCGGYGCMSLATLYYVLCLMITGKVPQVFYVAEISWIAAYLFYLSVSLSRKDIPIRTCRPAIIGALLFTVASITFKIMGPAPVTAVTFAVTIGTLAYRSIWGILQKGTDKLMDIMFLLMATLQIMLYIVSAFTSGYTSFNLYFLTDILLTLVMVGLFPALKREVQIS